MPSRNVYKPDVPESFYHIYARGGTKQPIFLDKYDFLFFLSLFERYLSTRVCKNKAGMPYPNYHTNLRLLSYCLMRNHFHLLVYQHTSGAMPQLMHGIMTSYSRYFNTKYKRTGSLFENRYKASLITDQAYLEHITRYIHLNPRYWQRYPYSSLTYYLGENGPDWIDSSYILDLFLDKYEYVTFLKDYEEHKVLLESLKHELADQ